ncbi:MAG TPA: metallopeptidase TldD-related protein [Terriglobia bacterium]|nr:metallopeptidase TldD-related protein [Terriglobia bacterium]
MRDELDRSMKQLQLENLEKPYFIAYHVQDTRMLNASATFGALLAGNIGRARTLAVEVRVGSYQLDNSNFFSYPPGANGLSGVVLLPIDDDYKELRRHIWLATDGAYKAALETLSRKRAALQNRTTREDIPDFTKEPAVTESEPLNPARMDLDQAKALVRSLSALFRQTPDIFNSSVSLEVNDSRSWYLNSEGTVVTRGSPMARVECVAKTQATDGSSLLDTVIAYGHTQADLPSEADLADRIRAMAQGLARLRQAPQVDRYNGPILFAGRAAGQLFAEVLGPKFVAQRLPVSDNPQVESYLQRNTNRFMDRLGARVLPGFLSVVDDPTRSSFQGTPLFGGHAVDDEGVRTRVTTIVEKGILKTLLTTRDPVPGLLQSSGSRRGFGAEPSDIMVSVENGASEKEMKDKLIGMVKQRGLGFGIEVRSVGNEAYKVYPDGHTEPMRQGQFEGLDDTAFKDMAAASQESTVYTVPFGAFGGNMVSQASAPVVGFVVPSMLFEDVTLKPRSTETEKLPLSKHPFFDK